MSFRIGSEHYGYNYNMMPGMQVYGNPVYECDRGRDDKAGKLYLYFDGELRTWHAVQLVGEPGSAIDIVRLGSPAFRFVQQEDDVRQPGEHNWQSYDAYEHKWWPPSAFMTTRL